MSENVTHVYKSVYIAFDVNGEPVLDENGLSVYIESYDNHMVYIPSNATVIRLYGWCLSNLLSKPIPSDILDGSAERGMR